MALKRRAPQRAATAWSFRLFSDKSKCLRLLGNACHKGDQASLEGPGDRMIVKDCMSFCSESSSGAGIVLATCGSEVIETADSGASPSKSKRLISIPPSASSSASWAWTASAETSEFPRILPSSTKWWTSKGTESSLRLRVFATASRWTSSCAKHSSTSFTLHSEMPLHTCVVAREHGNKAMQSYKANESANGIKWIQTVQLETSTQLESQFSWWVSNVSKSWLFPYLASGPASALCNSEALWQTDWGVPSIDRKLCDCRCWKGPHEIRRIPTYSYLSSFQMDNEKYGGFASEREACTWKNTKAYWLSKTLRFSDAPGSDGK